MNAGLSMLHPFMNISFSLGSNGSTHIQLQFNFWFGNFIVKHWDVDQEGNAIIYA